MKKITSVFISIPILLLMSSLSFGKSSGINITLGGGLKNMNEQIFKTVYGTSNIAYSIDLAYKTSGALEIFLHSDYLSSKGELEYSPKETTLSIIPAEIGVRFVLGKRRFTPYIGLGGGYYMLKEENFIGTVDEKQFGYFGEAGFRFHLGTMFFIDLKLKYNMLKYTMGDTTRDLSGLSYFGGIGFSF